MEQLVIYKLGETHLQTTVTNGYADFTDGKRVEAYLDELSPDYACLPIDQVIKMIGKAQEKEHIKPWKEIDAD